jgi:hypothetical protein
MRKPRKVKSRTRQLVMNMKPKATAEGGTVVKVNRGGTTIIATRGKKPFGY